MKKWEEEKQRNKRTNENPWTDIWRRKERMKNGSLKKDKKKKEIDLRLWWKIERRMKELNILKRKKVNEFRNEEMNG